MVVVNLVYGITLPLLSLVLDAQGISKTMIGLSIVAQACAGIVLAPVMPRLIVRIGAGRIMQLATLLSASMMILLGLIQDVYVWFPLRVLLGTAGAILWASSEALINELVEDNWRGRIIGLYGSAGAAGFALGPLVLVLTGTEGFLPFAVAAATIAVAGLPLFMLDARATASERDDQVSLRGIFRLVPHVMLLNMTYAAATESFLAFFPLFGIHLGLSEARSLSLLTTFAIGGVVLQLPLGWLADHMRRETLLLACVVLTTAGTFALPALVALNVAGPIFLFALGGVEGMIYALGVMLLGQRFRGSELAAATVLFTGMWAAGMILGPIVVGAGMDLFGNAFMPSLVAALFLCYLPVLVFRRK